MGRNEKYTHLETVHSIGLCATCNNFPDCAYLRNSEEPVLFCEDFDCSLPSSRTSIVQPNFVPIIPDPETDIEKKGYFKEYIGLCKSCKKLPMCTFTKPGGGSWRCEYYEKERWAN